VKAIEITTPTSEFIPIEEATDKSLPLEPVEEDVHGDHGSITGSPGTFLQMHFLLVHAHNR
jgi:hypothetical protein